MFQHFDQHKDSLQHDKYACCYAIFFHEWVFVKKAQDKTLHAVTCTIRRQKARMRSAASKRFKNLHTRQHLTRWFSSLSFLGVKHSLQSSYVCELIEATASHCTDVHLDPSGKTGQDDVHYFLDFDMAILGADAEGLLYKIKWKGRRNVISDYDQYRKQIREEYAHIDDRTFTQKRCKMLKLFLQIPNIYATAEFRESYEQKARANIEREIAELEKCV